MLFTEQNYATDDTAALHEYIHRLGTLYSSIPNVRCQSLVNAYNVRSERPLRAYIRCNKHSIAYIGS